MLTRLDRPLDDTVPARRSITLRDLLTFRLGIGAVLAPPGRYPIQRALADAGLAPGAEPPVVGPQEWLRRLGNLPLIRQPGEAWMYHTGSDVLGRLIERVTGGSLADFLRRRVFEPLGMRDTGFQVQDAQLRRLPTSYRADPETGHSWCTTTRPTASGAARPRSNPAGAGWSPRWTTIWRSAG